MKRNWTVGVLTLLTLVAGPAFARETTVSNHFAQEKVKEGAAQAKDAVVQGAKATAKGTKEVLSKTGEVITDGWITTRVNARFVNEDLLKDSDVTVDTDDHVVTLTGTVMSRAARAKAARIATRTEGVRRVVNHLTIGPKHAH